MPVRSGEDSESIQTLLCAQVRSHLQGSLRRAVVVTASGPLRVQLAGRLAEGGAAPGAEVQSLWRFARTILARCFHPESADDLRFPLECIAQDPLTRSIAAPDSGLAGAAADLFSAGVTDVDAALRALQRVDDEAWPVKEAAVRALDLVLRALPTGRSADVVLRTATHCLRSDPRALVGEAVHVVGFAGGTELVLDFLRALDEQGATIWIEWPADSDAALPTEQARAHALRFVRRLQGVEATVPVCVRDGDRAANAGRGSLEFVAAASGTAEADHLALRVHQQLRARPEVRPERIGVILADYDRRVPEIARALTELGVPFHGDAPGGVLTAEDRACVAVARLLEQGPTDHGLLRQAVADAASVNFDALQEDRQLTARQFAEWIRRADAVWCGQAGEATRSQAAGSAAAGTAACVDAAHQRLVQLVASLEAQPDLQFSAKVWRTWAARQLRRVGTERFGTAGHGVQLMNMAKARGLCFDQMYLLGAEAVHWPRSAHSNALLPEVARRALQQAGVARFTDEDPLEESAFSFVQLVHAARECTLMWQSVDDEGRSVPEAAWVKALQQSQPASEIVEVPMRPRERHEASLKRFGVLAPRAAMQLAGMQGLLALHAELRQRSWPADVAAVRARRLRAFDEPAWGELSAWHGRGISLHADEKAWSPTRLEAFARCGWNAYLDKELNVGAAGNPEQVRCEPSDRDFGNLTHKALELLLNDEEAALKTKFENSAAIPDALLQRVASRAIREWMARGERGSATALWCADTGLRRALERRLVQVQQHALEILRVQGVTEIEGCEVTIPGECAGLALSARIDLIANSHDGYLAIDWKTSKKVPNLGPKKGPLHLEHGAKLQGAIYSESQLNGAPLRGAYAMVSPESDLATDQRAIVVERLASEVMLARVLNTLRGLHRQQLLPPRPVKPDGEAEGEFCRRCDFRRCCVIGDSRQRAALIAAAERDGDYAEWFRRWPVVSSQGKASHDD